METCFVTDRIEDKWELRFIYNPRESQNLFLIRAKSGVLHNGIQICRRTICRIRAHQHKKILLFCLYLQGHFKGINSVLKYLMTV